MALHSMDCPHCRVKTSMHSACGNHVSTDSGYLLFVCPRCGFPVVLLIQADKPPHLFSTFHDVRVADQSIKKCSWLVIDSWPKPRFRRVEAPLGVPNNIGVMFEQSQDAALGGAHDLAMMGFVRVLRMAQAVSAAGKLSKPHAWILSEIGGGRLTKTMGPWANRVKGLRSEIQDAGAKEAEELASFVYVVLQQIFGVESRVASLRAADS
jgi:hypothetical protein